MQGAYIPPVLREAPQPDSSKDHSHSGFGYHSFGNTDHMGRKTPTGALSPTLQQSTLERDSSYKSKSSSGAGSTASIKDQAQGSQAKSFV